MAGGLKRPWVDAASLRVGQDTSPLEDVRGTRVGSACVAYDAESALTGPRWTSTADSATIVVMTTQSLRDVRDHLSEVIDRVEHQHDRVVVTRNGKPAAVILSPEDLAQLEETIDVLGDPQTLADIREADAAYARDDVIRGTDAVRQLRP